ncbi:MAG: thiosulfate oxidation carrier complex protein SoxZ [Rhodospirillales bacterium]|nr:thiosulfate oxidation carrier complex protein SoxZ [Rhodospirillales bacterium]
MLKQPLVKVPGSAGKGEIISIKTKLRHPMETGWRDNALGQKVPRNRINKFICSFNGKDVFSADLHSGISTDPYLMFNARVSESGTFRFIWYEDGGREYVKHWNIEVS